MQQLTLYTIGHGQRESEAFIDLLLAEEITMLVDIRSNPVSHFNESLLRNDLDAAGIVYYWAGKPLGGLRQGWNDSPNYALQDHYLRAFADYMMTSAFAQAAMQLNNLMRRGRTVIMGSDLRPEQCHRSLIADYLALQGMTILHIIDAGVIAEHYLRSEARKESAALIYDRLLETSLS